MPLYEYRCDACHHQFEKIQKFSDDPITVCPSCGQGPVVKLVSSPAIQFKGSGWYITDYARKDKGATAAAATGASKESGGDGRGTSANTKTDSSATPASTAAATTKE